MPSLIDRYAHIPAGTVRFWALLDTAVTWSLAIPVMVPYFIGFIYTLNGWLGGTPEPPEFAPIHMLFVCLTGSLVSIWVVARLLHPIGLFGVIDAWGRLWISLVLIWLIVGYDAPRVLWIFVFTEMAGTVGQLRAAWRSPEGMPTRHAS